MAEDTSLAEISVPDGITLSKSPPGIPAEIPSDRRRRGADRVKNLLHKRSIRHQRRIQDFLGTEKNDTFEDEEFG